jgi:hypothetical protein
MDALKGIEEFAGIGHIEARAVVPYKIYLFYSIGQDPEFYHGMLSFVREFPGIAEEILEDNQDQPQIAIHNKTVGDSEFHLPFRTVRGKTPGYPPGNIGQVDMLIRHLLPRYLGKAQQIVDEQAHLRYRGNDPVQETVCSRIESVCIIIQKNLTETGYRPQRSTQVVGDGVRKRLKLPIDHYQLIIQPFQRVGLLAADVGQHQATHSRPGFILRNGGFQTSPEGGSGMTYQSQFACLRFTRLEKLFSELMVDFLIFFENESENWLLQQISPSHSQEDGGCKIGFQNQPLVADKAIADRGEIVEIDETLLRGF